MTRTELRALAGVSTNVIAKMGRDESISMDTLVKICSALKCDISDVVEMSKTSTEGEVHKNGN